jgi:quinone-reactive Ni/Fe-hydrogenase small subunit
VSDRRNALTKLFSVKDAKCLTRRDFMKWASAACAMLMLPSQFTPPVAKAATLMNRLPVIWLELQDCAGNFAKRCPYDR